MFYTTYNGLVVPDVPLEETDILRSEAAKNNLELKEWRELQRLHKDLFIFTGIASHAPSLPLEGWTAQEGACRFPDAVCRGGRLTSLSLAAVKLNADFRAVANTLLQLSSVERLSLRGANVSGALAAARCDGTLEELDLSGNAALRGSLADVAALAGSCGTLSSGR
ncbi:putative brassinosteroid-insensitive 1 [Hordeum vulgare]|nr:putative brassinosteroid-insensitive 1 [Hordeum vulgare]